MKERVEHSQSSMNSESLNYSSTTKLVFGAILAAFAAIFQSAGIFVGFGYAFSILATLPIVLSARMSVRIGFMSYFLTIILLAIIQPSELLVFPFTTGLLGLSLGIGFKWWKNWIAITLFGGLALAAGIMLLLYVLHFPVLGPSVSDTFDIKIFIIILLFSIFYSLIWMGFSQKVSKILQRAASKKENSE